MLTKIAIDSQWGGPAGGVNDSTIGTIKELKKRGFYIYGSRESALGILHNDYRNFSEYGERKLRKIQQRPGAYLCTSKFPHIDERVAADIVAALKKKDAHYIFLTGGDSTANIARLINNAAKSAHYELIVVHRPKTIDNDLWLNDHTCGFGDAARTAALLTYGLDQENQSTRGFMLVSSQGRRNSDLAQAHALIINGNQQPLVYTPSHDFQLKYFMEDAEENYKLSKHNRFSHGRALIIFSEGIHRINRDEQGNEIKDKKGNTTYTDIGEDAANRFGIPVKKDPNGVPTFDTCALALYLACELRQNFPNVPVRMADPSYILRSFPLSSPVDSIEAEYVGRMAVRYAIDMNLGSGSVVIKRSGEGHTYSMYTEYAPLEEVAGKTKESNIENSGKYHKNVSQSFYDYAGPLIGPIKGFSDIDHLLPGKFDLTTILPHDELVYGWMKEDRTTLRQTRHSPAKLQERTINMFKGQTQEL